MMAATLCTSLAMLVGRPHRKPLLVRTFSVPFAILFCLYDVAAAEEQLVTRQLQQSSSATYPWVVSSGACEVVDNGCVQTLGFPSNYSTSSSCLIHARQSAFILEPLVFSTEAGTDILQVNGVMYSGTTIKRSMVFGDIHWTSNDAVTHGGWQICPRSSCATYVCPAGYVRKASASFIACESLECSDVDTESCCDPLCSLPSQLSANGHAIEATASSCSADASSSYFSERDCVVTCSDGSHMFVDGMSTESQMHCTSPGGEFNMPECAPPAADVEWTINGLCERYSVDCAQSAGFPSTYTGDCSMTIPSSYEITITSFDVEEGFDYLEVEGLFRATGQSKPSPFSLPSGSQIVFGTDDSIARTGFRMCARPLCSRFTCPYNYTFQCDKANTACQEIDCSDGLDTCCRVATSAEMAEPNRTGSDASSEGCFETSTVTTTTLGDADSTVQILGSIDIRVPRIVLELGADLIPAAWANFLSNISGVAAAQIFIKHTDDATPAEPYPDVYTWRLGCRFIGTWSMYLDIRRPSSVRLDEWKGILNDEMAALLLLDQSTLELLNISKIGLTADRDWPSDEVPSAQCSDFTPWTDGIGYTCEQYDDFCSLGADTGHAERYGSSYITLTDLVQRTSATQPNGLEACCECGGGHCMGGFYALSEQHPKFCAPCQMGRYNDEQEGDCKDCPPGQFTSDAGRSSCWAAFWGTAVPESGSSTYEVCPPGTFSYGGGAVTCDECPPGTSNPNWWSWSCTPCAMGTHAANSGTDTADCPQCPAGRFGNTTGLSECYPCPAGMESNSNGSSSCVPCVAGWFKASIGDEVCIECPAGSRSSFESGSHNCTLCEIGKYLPLPGQDSCLDCPAGTTSSVRGSLSCEDCPAGQFSAQPGGVCEPCAPGRFNEDVGQTECLRCSIGLFEPDFGSTACSQCQNGTFGRSEGESSCSMCDAGSYVSTAGSTECIPCQVGAFSSGLGQDRCLSCAEGSYAPVQGMSECLICGQGRYAAGGGNSECLMCDRGSFIGMRSATACELCSDHLPGPAEHWTTMEPEVSSETGELVWNEMMGATNASSCGCRKGTQPEGAVDIDYVNGGSPADPINGRGKGCRACGEGLLCMGMGQLRIAEEYAWDGDVGVYDCHKGTPEACTGGVPGACAYGRDASSISCSECLEGRVPVGDGTCQECSGADYSVPLTVVLVVAGCVCAAYMVYDRPKRKRPGLTSLLILISMGQLVTIVQQLGVISAVRVEWDAPLKDVLAFVASLGFLDVDLLRPGCVMSMDPVRKFMARVLAVYVCLSIIVVAHHISMAVQHGRTSTVWRTRMPILLCALGTIVMAFFVSIISTMLGPLQCKEHPNRQRTVAWFPGVLCWESDTHTAMLIIGIVASTLPLIFIASATRAAMRYPKELSKGAVNFLTGWAFLFFRYHTSAYWYGPVLLMRNALVAIAPAMATPVVQILFLQCVMLVSLIVVTRVLPWRARLANILEVLTHAALLLMMGVAAFFVTSEPGNAVAMFALVVLLCMPAGIIVMICYAAYRTCASRRKPFHFFLCHHKSGAGSFARLLKMRLLNTRGVSRKVFIDTDDLQNLDSLFDMVDKEVETLVAIHSAQLLMRPWCVGEIVTAQRANVSIQVVRVHMVNRPSVDFIENFEQYVGDIACLTERGINHRMVQEALAHFATLPGIKLPAELQDASMDALAKSLVGHAAKEGSKDLDNTQDIVPQEEHDEHAPLIILSDKRDVEASAIAYILRELMQPIVMTQHQVSAVVLPLEQEVPDNVKHMVMVCTDGIFDSPILAGIVPIVLSGEGGVFVLPLLSSSTFKFPEVKALRKSQCVSDLCEQDRETFLSFVQQIFQEIAVEFLPTALSATEALLLARATEVATRVMMKKDIGSMQSFMGTKVRGGSRNSSQEDCQEASPRSKHLSSISWKLLPHRKSSGGKSSGFASEKDSSTSPQGSSQLPPSPTPSVKVINSLYTATTASGFLSAAETGATSDRFLAGAAHTAELTEVTSTQKASHLCPPDLPVAWEFDIDEPTSEQDPVDVHTVADFDAEASSDDRLLEC